MNYLNLKMKLIWSLKSSKKEALKEKYPFNALFYMLRNINKLYTFFLAPITFHEKYLFSTLAFLYL